MSESNRCIQPTKEQTDRHTQAEPAHPSNTTTTQHSFIHSFINLSPMSARTNGLSGNPILPASLPPCFPPGCLALPPWPCATRAINRRAEPARAAGPCRRAMDKMHPWDPCHGMDHHTHPTPNHNTRTHRHAHTHAIHRHATIRPTRTTARTASTTPTLQPE